MILADTSVWIDYFKGDRIILPKFRFLLSNRQILAISPVFGELLQGVKNDYERNIVLEYWNNLPKIDETDFYIEAGIISAKFRLFSQGVGLIDAFLIVTMLQNDLEIWTKDKKLLNSIELINNTR